RCLRSHVFGQLRGGGAMADEQLKLIFVSGVSVGGAPRSTLELASVLGERGHDVRVVLGSTPDDWREALFRAGVSAWVKSADRITGRAILPLLRRSGARFHERARTDEQVTVYIARHPENAYR